MEKFDIVIAGAGIVGVSAGLWAQKSGLQVAICDPGKPGDGATYGSACTVSTYACVPINSPSIFTSLPTLLFSKDSPLSFDYGYALKNLPWMLSFLSNCRPSRVEHISRSLGQLLRLTDEGLDPLIAEAGAEDLFVKNDCLYVWSTKQGFEDARAGNEMRREQGVVFDVLNEQQILELEPSLKMPIHKGLLFKGARHILDPRAYVQKLYDRFLELGGVGVEASVERVDEQYGDVFVQLDQGEGIQAKHAVIAAGASSRKIKGVGLEELPLGVERGYHVVYKDHGQKVSRPVGWAEAGLYATPTASGLRIAGTVEISDPDAPINNERIEYLKRRARQMFGPLDGPFETWHGNRPTMPDALPVIGPSKNSNRVFLAFGHQHIGLTLGGITGRIVADYVSGEGRTWDTSDFSDKRFK